MRIMAEIGKSAAKIVMAEVTAEVMAEVRVL